MSKAKLIQTILGAAAVIGTSAVAYYFLSKKYDILKEQDVKPRDFKTETLDKFLLEDKNHDNSQRLKRAYELLPKDSDLSGFLAFTTFERHIREIATYAMPNAKESAGIRNLAGRLRTKQIIPRETYDRIKAFTIEVRNPIVHGSPVYCTETLRDSLDFIKQFLNDYPLSQFQDS